MVRKPNVQRRRVRDRREANENVRVETFGEALPGLLLEAVSDTANSGQLLLHSWDGYRTNTAHEVKHDGVCYFPKNPGTGLARWVRFAPPSAQYQSTAKLTSSLETFLCKYIRLQPEALSLVMAFVLATWFCGSMPVAPVLYLYGPESEVSQLLRLLGCCCYRPLLLGDIDFASLATLPHGLGATLLINQLELTRRIKRVLLASNRRHFYIVRGKGRVDLYGAKAFSCDHLPTEGHGLRASVPPSQDPLPSLSDSEELTTADSLQRMLLRYRLVNYETVMSHSIDCSEFIPEMREEARTWLAPTFDLPKLTRAVRSEILRQSQEAAERRFFDPTCIVVESALFFCHRSDTQHFLVGELAEKVNALLKGRHEESELSAKRVGSVLRDLGIRGRRVAEGYKILLTDIVRKRIHELAYAYQVLSVADGVQRCPQCRKTRASRSVAGDVHMNE